MHSDGFAIASGLRSAGHACRPSLRRREAPHPLRHGGEQSPPPRSAAIKSARARGLADLIDNPGAAPSCDRLSLNRAGCGQIPVGRRPAFAWRRNFWVAPPETRPRRISGIGPDRWRHRRRDQRLRRPIRAQGRSAGRRQSGACAGAWAQPVSAPPLTLRIVSSHPGRCRAKAVGRSEISARGRACGARRSVR